MVSARRMASAVLAATCAAIFATAAAGPAVAASCSGPAPAQLSLSGPLSLWGPDHNGNWHVVGAVNNTGRGAAAEVAVGYTVLDAAGRAIVSDKRFTWSPIIGPGQDSGFDAPLFRPASRPASVRFRGITSGTPTTLPHRFPVTVTAITHQAGTTFGTVKGTARNDLTVPVFSIALSIVLRNSSGQVVGVVPGTTDDAFGGGQAPGATQTWVMNIDTAIPAWSTYAVEAISDTPAASTPAITPCLSPIRAVPSQVGVAAAGQPVAGVAPHTLAPSFAPGSVATHAPPMPVPAVRTSFPTIVPNAVAETKGPYRLPWLLTALILVIGVGWAAGIVANRRSEP